MLSPTPGQPTKKPLHIPVKLGLLGGNGNDLPLELANGHAHRRRRARADQAARDVPFRQRADATGALAAARLLGAGEPDHRSDAGRSGVPDGARQRRVQPLAGGAGLCDAPADRGVGALQKKQPAPDASAFIDALGLIVADERLDPALRAQALALPSESDIARMIGRDIDPAAIHRVRKALRRKLAQRLGAKLEDLYQGHAVKSAYAPTPEQIGKRSLRNAALSMLVAARASRTTSRARTGISKPPRI